MARSLRLLGAYLLVCLIPVAAARFPSVAARFSPGEAVAGLLPYVPVIALALVGYLGWKLNQVRIVATAVLLLGLYGLLGHPRMLLSDAIRLAALAVPLTLAAIFAFREGPLVGGDGLGRLVLVLSPVIALAALLAGRPATFHAVAGWRPGPFAAGLRCPPAALAGLLPLGITALAVRARGERVGHFVATLAVALLPFFLAVHLVLAAGPDAATPALVAPAFAALSAVVLHAVLNIFWERVYVDELTEVYNRRALEEQFAKLTAPYTLAMIDVDHFKQFNDVYGHDQGDDVLRLVAGCLRKEFGAGAHRYGGEEFCVIMPGMSPEEARHVAERARGRVEKRSFHVRASRARRHADPQARRPVVTRAGRRTRVTVSMGLAAWEDADDSPVRVLKRADEALYEAKARGRNRVVVFDGRR